MKLGYIFGCNVNLVRIYALMHGLRSSGQTFRPWAGAGSSVLISYKRIRRSRQCLRGQHRTRPELFSRLPAAGRFTEPCSGGAGACKPADAARADAFGREQKSYLETSPGQQIENPTGAKCHGLTAGYGFMKRAPGGQPVVLLTVASPSAYPRYCFRKRADPGKGTCPHELCARLQRLQREHDSPNCRG